ncbi:hypothetical protein AB0B31_16010 [Catellatospora citrea]|uniref:hypothetical protein n=1 Tax=Catellatospora citrea TaxID=53366 RepID=UPI0033D51773
MRTRKVSVLFGTAAIAAALAVSAPVTAAQASSGPVAAAPSSTVATQDQPVADPWRDGYRQGYRDGFKDAKDDCQRSYASRQFDNWKFAQGYEAGFGEGWEAGVARYC